MSICARARSLPYQQRLEGHVDVAAAQLAVIGLSPRVDAAARAEAGAVLEAADHLDGALVVVEKHLSRRVEMHVFEVGAALAVAIVAVRVDVVCGSARAGGPASGGEAEGERHGGRHRDEGTVVDRKNGRKARLDHRRFEDARERS